MPIIGSRKLPPMIFTCLPCCALIHRFRIAVIATLGPACRDVDTLVSLLESGLAAARVDLTVRIHANACLIQKVDTATIFDFQPVMNASTNCWARMCLQWGSLEYHKQSLRNLQAATQKTKSLCAVILDTVGRELMIKRDYELDDEVCTHCPPKPLLNSGQASDIAFIKARVLAGPS